MAASASKEMGLPFTRLGGVETFARVDFSCGIGVPRIHIDAVNTHIE